MSAELPVKTKPIADTVGAALKPVVFCIGASHRTAPAALRESLYLNDEQLTRALAGARRESFEVAALSTCNRFVVLGVCRTDDAHENKLLSLFIDLQHGGGNAAVDHSLQPHLYFHTGKGAIAHVFRVASSLDSLVVGETQITGQFKAALELARRAETIGPILHRLAQEALAIAKKVRSQTDIGKKPVSISHAAIDLAARVYGSLSRHAVLVIGAGEMAALAAKYLATYEPKRLVIANRSAGRAHDLVSQLGKGEGAGLDDLPRLLRDCDIVIVATSAPKPILCETDVRAALPARKGKPLLLIDIAIPRNIDPACGTPDDVFLFDIDDLRKVVDANQKDRQTAADKAQSLVDEGVFAFTQWLAALSVKPTLARFRTYLNELIRKEATRTFSREALRALAPEQQAAVSALLDTLASRLSSDVSSRVLTPLDGYYSEQLADALEALFPLSPIGAKGDPPRREQKS